MAQPMRRWRVGDGKKRFIATSSRSAGAGVLLRRESGVHCCGTCGGCLWVIRSRRVVLPETTSGHFVSTSAAWSHFGCRCALFARLLDQPLGVLVGNLARQASRSSFCTAVGRDRGQSERTPGTRQAERAKTERFQLPRNRSLIASVSARAHGASLDVQIRQVMSVSDRRQLNIEFVP